MKPGMERTLNGVTFTCSAGSFAYAYRTDDTERKNPFYVKLEYGSIWIQTEGVRQKADSWEDAAWKIRGFLAPPVEQDPEGDERLRKAFACLPDTSEQKQ